MKLKKMCEWKKTVDEDLRYCLAMSFWMLLWGFILFLGIIYLWDLG